MRDHLGRSSEAIRTDNAKMAEKRMNDYETWMANKDEMDMPGVDAPEDAETTVEASFGADSFADSGGSDAGYNGDEDGGSA